MLRLSRKSVHTRAPVLMNDLYDFIDDAYQPYRNHQEVWELLEAVLDAEDYPSLDNLTDVYRLMGFLYTDVLDGRQRKQLDVYFRQVKRLL